MTEILTPDKCRQALTSVIDPEIYQNIVDLGLVYAIDVAADDRVEVTMTLTTPHCPMGPQIIEEVEKTLIAAGATAVNVKIVWEPMWTPDAMTDELKRELGILEEEPEMEIEPAFYLPPQQPAKKKGFFSRLLGR